VSGVDLLSRVLLWAGVAVVVSSVLSAVWLRGTFVRLHYLAPVTAVGGPLIGLALAIENGWGLTTGLVLLVVALLAISGPVVEVATARALVEQQGLPPAEEATR
jgi:multicomponent Na+:H+ antiporter subunit G